MTSRRSGPSSALRSSGPGIWTRLLLQSFLGLRWERSILVVDPVIPKSLNGLRVEMKLGGYPVEVIYHIEGYGYGPRVVNLNGADLPFTRVANPYRIGAARISMAAVRQRLTTEANRLTVQIG